MDISFKMGLYLLAIVFLDKISHMDFGIAITTEETAQFVANFVQDLSDRLGEYFKDKDYGNGIKSLAVGATILAPAPPGFEHLFKARKPKYTKAKKTIDFHGIPITIERCLEYDIKLDPSEFTGLSDREIKKMLSEKVLTSLSVFDEIKQKIAPFDSDRFKADTRSWFDDVYLQE
ncbi:hypothetical protein [uncultured Pedobacter sp.]|uniref:hypothetical protein n=1 Tax=uncultured Pedobacter sp. TaxID=246139 RepID=UPI00261FE34A|nr:hypothetical protein [uncultured Pedobacter sp.]